MSKTNILLVILVLSVTCFPAFGQYSDYTLVRDELCFEHFIPILQNVAKEYSRSYQECTVDEESHIDDSHPEAVKRIQNSKIIFTATVGQDSELYRTNFEIERCQNLSQRTFVENTARGYYNLRLCLKPIDSLDTTTTERQIEITTPSSSEEDDPSITQETTDVVNTTATTTLPSNSVPDTGSNSVSKIQVSSSLLLLNIWIVFFQSRNS